MKTYLLNIPKELKRISQELDVKAVLCNKTWEALNDEGNKQVFIFQNQNKLLISTNGNVTNSTWEFISANNSIVITAEGQTTMLRPAFIDGVIFAMQKDGTQECLFLIDEHNKSICPNRTLTELRSYFQRKLEKLEKKPKDIAEQQEEEKKRLERIAEEHQDEIKALIEKRKKRYIFLISFASTLFLISVILSVIFQNYLFALFILFAFIVGFWDLILFLALSTIKEDAENEVVSKYK